MAPLEDLCCPIDGLPLKQANDQLSCGSGHRYPVIDGVPVLLVGDEEQTHYAADRTLKLAAGENVEPENDVPGYYLGALGLSRDERHAVAAAIRNGDGPIDPVVSYSVGGSSGYMYSHLIGKMKTYPIPELRLPEGDGRTLLDIGSGWGRWSIAAARKGYAVTAIDPSIANIMTVQRVAKDLDLNIRCIVGDGRSLPFPEHSFDAVFSYSVIQHLSKENARRVLSSVRNILRPDGISLIQMPNRYGIRCLYHQCKQGFNNPDPFAVRYWTLPELREAFTECIGPSTLTVDGYFGLGMQSADKDLMPPHKKLILGTSDALRKLK